MTTHLLERLSNALADRYRIERELGQGGMATVFLAEDIKHRRRVAVKVLKPELAAVLGAERFVQEITTTAALQHPHILPLFDSGSADGFLYYVMPFVDGETLRDRLNRETQLGVDDAVRIASDVADALHYAHTQGVIHRDIKPENILLANGRPMVADFGIALAVSAAAGGRMTETGLSLGTPHYMSPEQATAEKQISARSDIYSLASVLYEMLSGEPPHMGNSAQQIIMKIIAEPAQPVTKLRRSVPSNVAAALTKGLEKLPADRFDSASAFAAALHDPHFTTGGFADASSAVSVASSRAWFANPVSWAALAMIAALSIYTVVGGRKPRETAAALRFAVLTPPDSSFISTNARGPREISLPVVSPTARHVAFAVERTGGTAIHVRPLDADEFIPVAEGRVGGLFWSPDGSALGYFAQSDLWAMRLADRRPVRIAAVPEMEWDIAGAAWHSDGRILITGSRGIWAVPALGGDAQLLVSVASGSRESMGGLEVLPDGRLLIVVTDSVGSHVEVIVGDGSRRTPILDGAVSASFVDGVMLHVRGGQLRAVRFDLRSLKEKGPSITLPTPATRRLGASLAWTDERISNVTPAWRKSDGTIEPIDVPPATYRWPRLSPDGRRIAIGNNDPQRFRSGMRVYDLDRRSWSSLDGTTEPAWTPDGRHVIQSVGNRPTAGLVMQVADGSRGADTLLKLSRADAWPTDVSTDGKWLAYYGAALGEGDKDAANDPGDLYFLDLASREPRRARLPGSQRGARFSPDMRWIAYESAENGISEVIIRDWPALAARYVVSGGEGTEPVWSRDGRRLHFRRGNGLLVVNVDVTGENVLTSAPAVLFSGNFRRDESGDQSYDVGADGRVLFLRSRAGGRATVEIALNWIAEVRARLDAGKQ